MPRNTQLYSSCLPPHATDEVLHLTLIPDCNCYWLPLITLNNVFTVSRKVVFLQFCEFRMASSKLFSSVHLPGCPSVNLPVTLDLYMVQCSHVAQHIYRKTTRTLRYLNFQHEVKQCHNLQAVINLKNYFRCASSINKSGAGISKPEIITATVRTVTVGFSEIETTWNSHQYCFSQ